MITHARIQIPAPIGCEQNLPGDFCQVGAAQPAIAMTAIQPRFHVPALGRIIRLFQDGFKLRAARDGKGKGARHLCRFNARW